MKKKKIQTKKKKKKPDFVVVSEGDGVPLGCEEIDGVG